MSVNINEKDLQTIVEEVIKNISQLQGSNREEQRAEVLKEIKIAPSSRIEPQGAISYSRLPAANGVFDVVNEAIEAADRAQKNLAKNFNVEDRERFISAIRKMVLQNKESLGKMVY